VAFEKGSERNSTDGNWPRIDVGTPQSIHEYRGLFVCVILAHCTYLIGTRECSDSSRQAWSPTGMPKGLEASSTVDLALGSRIIGTKVRGSSKYSSFYRRRIMHGFIASDGSDDSICGS
jgi:hypothetical protein